MTDDQDGLVKINLVLYDGLHLDGWMNCHPCHMGYPDAQGVHREYPAESVDYIRAYYVMQTLDAERWFLWWEEAWRILRVEGVVEVVTPFGASPLVWANPLNRIVIVPERWAFLNAEYLRQKPFPGPWRPLTCNFDAYCEVTEGPFPELVSVLTKVPLPESWPVQATASVEEQVQAQVSPPTAPEGAPSDRKRRRRPRRHKGRRG